MAVSTSTEVSERELEELSMQLRSITENMRIFSLSIRSLYAENAIDTLSDTGVEFNSFRDDIRNDALVYVKALLPLSTKFVRKIRDFSGDYEAMEYGDWEKGLGDELEKIRGDRQFCEVLLYMHEKVMTELKKKEDRATKLVKKLAATSREFEMKMGKMTEAANLKEKLATIIIPLPKAGPFASIALQMYSQYQKSSAATYQGEAVVYGEASAVVKNTLIPALAAFLDALRGISGIFSVLENSLISFQDKGLDAEGKIDSAKETKQKARMENHHQVMKSRARDMKENCDKFFAVLPDMRTNLAAIPEEGTDTNLVRDWLEERKSEIRQELEGRVTSELVQSEILDLTL